MSKHKHGVLVVGLFLMGPHAAYALSSGMDVEKCMQPNKTGGQTCFVKGSIGKVGEGVSVYDASSLWKGTGKVTKAENRRGLAEVYFEETLSPVQQGYQVINNSGEDEGALDWRFSFSKSDAAFDSLEPIQGVDSGVDSGVELKF